MCVHRFITVFCSRFVHCLAKWSRLITANEIKIQTVLLIVSCYVNSPLPPSVAHPVLRCLNGVFVVVADLGRMLQIGKWLRKTTPLSFFFFTFSLGVVKW